MERISVSPNEVRPRQFHINTAIDNSQILNSPGVEETNSFYNPNSSIKEREVSQSSVIRANSVIRDSAPPTV